MKWTHGLCFPPLLRKSVDERMETAGILTPSVGEAQMAQPSHSPLSPPVWSLHQETGRKPLWVTVEITWGDFISVPLSNKIHNACAFQRKYDSTVRPSAEKTNAHASIHSNEMHVKQRHRFALGKCTPRILKHIQPRIRDSYGRVGSQWFCSYELKWNPCIQTLLKRHSLLAVKTPILRYASDWRAPIDTVLNKMGILDIFWWVL